MSAVATSARGTSSPSILPLTEIEPFGKVEFVLASYVVGEVFTTSIISVKLSLAFIVPNFKSKELSIKPGIKLLIVVPYPASLASFIRMSLIYKLPSVIVKSTLPLKLMCCVSPTAHTPIMSIASAITNIDRIENNLTFKLFIISPLFF